MEDSYKHKGMRRILVKKLREKGIANTEVLSAIEKVPRHVFFDKAFEEHAYQDKAFPIGEGQTISQPYTVAYQTQLLQINRGDKVLEIGTGSGYQCCVLLEMGAKVVTVETIKSLYEKTKATLPKLGYQATFVLGDGTLGVPHLAPYNKIIVTAGAPDIPAALVDQLALGGIMVIPVGNEKNQTMIKITKEANGAIRKESLEMFRFVPLKGKQGWASGS